MKKLLPFFLVLLFFASSCTPDKIQEGEIEYAITYPHAEISGFMQAILPETMTIAFKGTKMKTTISRGKIFSTEIISDEADRSVEMRLDFGDKLFYTVLNPEEVDRMIASQPVYQLKATEQQDSLVGLFAQSYAVATSHDTIIHEDIWFTEDLAPQHAYWFTPYASINGMPLIYDAERYGVIMHLEATKFTPREIGETEFDRSSELTEVTFDEYEAEVQELFDILME